MPRAARGRLQALQVYASGLAAGLVVATFKTLSAVTTSHTHGIIHASLESAKTAV